METRYFEAKKTAQKKKKKQALQGGSHGMYFALTN